MYITKKRIKDIGKELEKTPECVIFILFTR